MDIGKLRVVAGQRQHPLKHSNPTPDVPREFSRILGNATAGAAARLGDLRAADRPSARVRGHVRARSAVLAPGAPPGPTGVTRDARASGRGPARPGQPAAVAVREARRVGGRRRGGLTNCVFSLRWRGSVRREVLRRVFRTP